MTVQDSSNPKKVIPHSFGAEFAIGDWASSQGQISTGFISIAPEWWTSLLCGDQPSTSVEPCRIEAPDTLCRGLERVHLQCWSTCCVKHDQSSPSNMANIFEAVGCLPTSIDDLDALKTVSRLN